MTDKNIILQLAIAGLLLLSSAPSYAAETKIDRHALVTRHNITLNAFNMKTPIQVGNGGFAFAVDVTGLQTFTEGTFSDWGWHTFPNPQGFREEETWGEITGGGGRKVNYASNHHLWPKMMPEQRARAEGAWNWFRLSPHRLPLGRIRFELLKPDGRAAQPADLQNIRQTLDLWTGMVHSAYEIAGVPVEVSTCCHPKQDAIAVQVRSKLLADGRLKIVWQFPFLATDGTSTYSASNDGLHRTDAALRGANRADIARTLNADRYFVSAVWNKGEWKAQGAHAFVLAPARDTAGFDFVCGFAPQDMGELPNFAETAAASAQQWQAFWQSGGAIDLSASKDPRWRELERRIVLSQYLTAVNSTGSSPPQESGLFSTDSWNGKFHLEMTAWHGVHFVLWGRASLLEGWMKWMRGPGLESAKRQAAKQGYQGARWMKMVAPDARWESPSAYGPFRMNQQGHAIYWAELMYREQPMRQTLEQFRDIVMESAAFMADYVWWDEKTGRYVLGPPLLTGSEATDWQRTYNSTVELSYWFYGLRTAQLWRERLGLPREAKWDEILAKLSKPPVVAGLCVEAENVTFRPSKSGHYPSPAWLTAYGCMSGWEIDREAMRRSFDFVWGKRLAGKPWAQTWGCDYPMLAMTAARLGKPKDAVNALLLDSPGNVYLPNGFSNAGSTPYLPASGGLLWAVAMMAAGWDGGPDKPAPGFPDDGSWVIRWEGLKKAP